MAPWLGLVDCTHCFTVLRVACFSISAGRNVRRQICTVSSFLDQHAILGLCPEWTLVEEVVRLKAQVKNLFAPAVFNFPGIGAGGSCNLLLSLTGESSI